MEVRWIAGTGAVPLPLGEVREVVSRQDGVVWVDLDHTDEQGMTLLTDLIRVQPTDLQECFARTPVPKLHVYTDHLFSAINGLARGTDGRLHFQPLKIFFNLHLLVTVLGPTHDALTVEAGTPLALDPALPDLPWELADARNAVVVRSPAGDLSGGAPRRYYRLTSRGRAAGRGESERIRRLVQVAEERSWLPGIAR